MIVGTVKLTLEELRELENLVEVPYRTACLGSRYSSKSDIRNQYETLLNKIQKAIIDSKDENETCKCTPSGVRDTLHPAVIIYEVCDRRLF